jgi:hypothetical protein
MSGLNLQSLRAFTTDERGGERDTLTTLLILALVILPLVALIIFFGNEIQTKVEQVWTSTFGKTVKGK